MDPGQDAYRDDTEFRDASFKVRVSRGRCPGLRDTTLPGSVVALIQPRRGCVTKPRVRRPLGMTKRAQANSNGVVSEFHLSSHSACWAEIHCGFSRKVKMGLGQEANRGDNVLRE